MSEYEDVKAWADGILSGEDPAAESNVAQDNADEEQSAEDQVEELAGDEAASDDVDPDVGDEGDAEEDQALQEEQKPALTGKASRINKLTRDKKEALDLAERYKNLAENYEKRLQGLEETIRGLSGEQKPEANDVDEVLRQHGLDPDSFLDDDVKKSVADTYQKLGKIDKIEQRQTQGEVVREMDSAIARLPQENQQEVLAAIRHVLTVEAQQRKLNYQMIGKDVSNADIERETISQFQTVATQLRDRGVDPLVWAYQQAQAMNFQYQAPVKARKASANPDAVEALRQKTSAPDADADAVLKMGAGKSPFKELAEDPKIRAFG